MGATVSVATLLASAAGKDAFFDEDANDPNGFTIVDNNTSFHIAGGSGNFVGHSPTDGVFVPADQLNSTFFHFGNEAFDDFMITGASPGSISSFFFVNSSSLPPQIGFDNAINSVNEGSVATYNLTRSFVQMGDTGSSVHVHFNFSDPPTTALAAGPNQNYIASLTALPGTTLVDNGGDDWTVTFAPGAKTAAFTVKTLDDHVIPAANPLLELYLSDPQGAALNTAFDTIDTTILNIDKATVSGATTDAMSGVVHAGQHVHITLTFSDPVNVAGNPTLKMSDGGIANLFSWTGNTVTFDYQPKLGENIPDLKIGSLVGGASIKDETGQAANLLGASGLDLHLKIDTFAPTITKLASLNGSTLTPLNPLVSLADGDHVTFSVTFSEPVAVTGTPDLLLGDGAKAVYAGGTGTNTLTFDYGVKEEGTTDLKIVGFDGSIADLAGNSLSSALNIDTKLQVNVFKWTSAVSGGWSDGSKWTPAGPPGNQSAALITAAGPLYTVTVSDTADKMTSIGTLVIGKNATVEIAAANEFDVLFGGSNAGTVSLDDGAIFGVGVGVSTSTFTNNGLIKLNGSTAPFTAFGTADDMTLAGIGTIDLGTNGKGAIGNATGVDASITNLGNKITGAGGIGDNPADPGHHFSFINTKGVVAASGGELDISASHFSNGGILEAVNGGMLHVATDIANTSKTALVETLAANAHITLQDADITGGKVSIFKGSFLDNSAGDNTISATVANNGTIDVQNGHLTIQGAVSGTGTATISNGGTLEFDSISSTKVSFDNSANDVLALNATSTTNKFTGTITNFNINSEIDLNALDDSMSNAHVVSYKASATGGTLTVGDGVHTQSLTFVGHEFTTATTSDFDIGQTASNHVALHLDHALLV